MNRPAIEGGKPIRDIPIYYGHQYIDQEDIKAVEEVLRSDYLTCGPKIGELEELLCHITGAKYAIVVSNGTAALHLACMAAGVGDGDEVITTPITFAASANCALYCGAKPVFADIDNYTYNIDIKSIKSKISDNTKAIVAVDYTGATPDIDGILELCKENGIVYIEDAAHSIGTIYKGRKVGSIADMTTLSFHPVKTVTAGEGGAILTNNEEYANKLRLYRTHGITRDTIMMSKPSEGDWYYEQAELGYNYRMTDMQAALLISQLGKLDMFAKRRAEIVAEYNNAFSKFSSIQIQEEVEGVKSVRHLYLLRIKPDKLNINRRELYDALFVENIVCNVHYIPVYYFPYYAKLGYERGLCPIAEKLYEEIITLPLYYGMSDEDVKSVIKAVERIVMYYEIL